MYWRLHARKTSIMIPMEITYTRITFLSAENKEDDDETHLPRRDAQSIAEEVASLHEQESKVQQSQSATMPSAAKMVPKGDPETLANSSTAAPQGKTANSYSDAKA